MTILEEIAFRLVQAVLALDRVAVRQIMVESMNVSAQGGGVAFAGDVLSLALRTVGEQWLTGALALSQVYMSARLCEQVMQELIPRSVRAQGETRIAMVSLIDRHALGKTIVLSILAACGIPVVDYGAGVSVDEVVGRVQTDRPDVLLVSTLLLPSAFCVKELCERLRALSLQTRVVVGGAPFVLDPELWTRVGADAVGYSAGEAPRIIQALTGLNKEGAGLRV